MNRFAFVLAFLLLLCCSCNMPIASTSPEPTTPAEPVFPETEPVITTVPETQPTEPTIPESTEPTTTVPTEPVTTPETTESNTEPSDPEPVELSFSSYQQGTTGYTSITSDEGITISVDPNYYFEFPEYKGIKFLPKMEAVMRHFDFSITFGCKNGSIERIEVLGPDKKPIVDHDGRNIEPVVGNTVPSEYRMQIGYCYLRIFVISDAGERFEVLMIAGTM